MTQVPVIILGGFLGSGKTTLLRRLLQDPGGRQIAVIVNDFGELNVDAALVAEVSDDVVALTNGCLCCSARGDLGIAAKRLMAPNAPPRATQNNCAHCINGPPWHRIVSRGSFDPGFLSI